MVLPAAPSLANESLGHLFPVPLHLDGLASLGRQLAGGGYLSHGRGGLGADGRRAQSLAHVQEVA